VVSEVGVALFVEGCTSSPRDQAALKHIWNEHIADNPQMICFAAISKKQALFIEQDTEKLSDSVNSKTK